MGFTVEQAARMYSVPIVEYPDPWRPRGLLLSSGCGIMMSVMDQVPLRWCADVDRMSDSERARLPEFMLMTSQPAGVLAVCGWFSHHSPSALRDGLSRVGRGPCYGGSTRFGLPWESRSLGDFLADVRAALETARASLEPPDLEDAG